MKIAIPRDLLIMTNNKYLLDGRIERFYSVYTLLHNGFATYHSNPVELEGTAVFRRYKPLQINLPNFSMLLRMAFFAVMMSMSFMVLSEEVPMQPVLRIETGEHLSLITKISSSANGRFIATASEDKTVRIWDALSGRQLQVLRPPIGDGSLGVVYAAALSPDGATVAVGGNSAFKDQNNSIYLFDRATGKLRKNGTLSGLESPIHQLAWSHDGQFLAIGLRQGGLFVFRKDLKFFDSDPEYNDVVYGADFSHDGRLVTSSPDGAIRVYQLDKTKLNRIARTLAPGGKPYTVAFSPDGTSIAVGYLDSTKVDILDANTLTVNYSAEYGHNGNLGRVAWSRDGHTLFAGGKMNSNGRFPLIAFADAGRGEGRELQSFGNTIMSLTPSGDGIAVASADIWATFDRLGNQRYLADTHRADFRDNGENFCVSVDGRVVSFLFNRAEHTKTIFNGQYSELRSESNASDGILVAPLTVAPGIKVENWKNSTSPKLNGVPLALLPHEPSRSLAVMADGSRFVLGTEWYLRNFDASGRQIWEQRIPGAAWAVNYSGDGRWVLAALADGTIRWYRTSDGQPQMALFAHSDRSRWILWTPAGYYDTSVGGESLIGWHMNRAYNKESDFFTVGRFRNQYYRPEVLQKIFMTGDIQEALLALQSEAAASTAALAKAAADTTAKAADATAKVSSTMPAPIAVQTVLPPVIELETDTQIETDATSVPVKYALRSPNDAPVTEVKVRVDGKLITTGDPGKHASRGIEAGFHQVMVPVPSDKDADILILAKNKNAASEPITIHIKRLSKVSGDDQPVKFKKLYLLAVGVSKYPKLEEKFQLDSPAKDAADFIDMFKKYGTNLYGEMEIRVLQNEQATSQHVLEGLKWLKDKVGPDDMGILFLAGHGINDPVTGKYFYASSDLVAHRNDEIKDYEYDDKTYVPGLKIQEMISNMRGRGIVFLDTCNSGNALEDLNLTKKENKDNKNTNVTALLNEADDEKGVAVLSATSGKQKAGEADDLNNGFFTYAIKEGVLDRKADYVKDGRITPPALLIFVSQKIKELAKKYNEKGDRAQTPKMVGASFNEPFIVVK
jgi:WD40 repeat protein